MLIICQDLYVYFGFFSVCIVSSFIWVTEWLCQIKIIDFNFARCKYVFKSTNFSQPFINHTKKVSWTISKSHPSRSRMQFIEPSYYWHYGRLIVEKTVSIILYKTILSTVHRSLQTSYGYLLASMSLFFLVKWAILLTFTYTTYKPLIRSLQQRPMDGVVYAAILSQFVLKRWVFREAFSSRRRVPLHIN